MLKVMRDSFKHLKWILVFVVFLFVFLVFVDWGAGRAAGRGVSPTAVAARVNDQSVTIGDFERSLYFMQRNYEQLYGQTLTPQMVEALNLPQQVLNSLVDRQLLLQEAERLGLTATPEEVRKKILEIPTLSPEGRFVGQELYERYVTANLGYTSAAAFEDEIAQEITLEKLESALANSLIISPATVEAEFRARSENARIQYVFYSAERAGAALAPTEAEIEAHYRANASRYSHQEQRQVKYLLADAAQFRAQASVPEEQLRAEYEKNKESFKSGEAVRAQHILIRTEAGASPEEEAAAKARADALYEQIRGGADFGKLASENSGDPGSAARGGDLGFFERGQMVPEFENAAFSLSVGEVSQPVKSDFGYHIIKLSEKRPAGFQAFEEVRPALERQLTEGRVQEQARDRIAQARARLQQAKPVSDDSFRSLATSGLTYNDTGWFTRNDAIAGIGRNLALTEWAFNAKPGDIGEIFDTSRGPVVPYVANARPQGTAPLAEVRQQVDADVRKVKGREAARAALASAAGGGSIEAAAAAVGAQPAEATVTRQGSLQGAGSARPVAEAALSASVGEIRGPVLTEEGAVLFKVLEQRKFNQQEFAAERDALVRQMREGEARKLRNALLAKLRRQSNIVVNDDLVRRGQAAPGV
jgi:peptidyl-prolyl cis-trans isomerase D